MARSTKVTLFGIDETQMPPSAKWNESVSAQRTHLQHVQFAYVFFQIVFVRYIYISYETKLCYWKC